MKATIWHNPRCGTSRKTLDILRETPGVEVEVIEYLATPPTRETLAALYARAGMTPRDGLRAKEPLATEMALASASDDAILDAMMAHPILINRPLVATDKGVRLCRPQDVVKEIL
ncbi:arsenate reductase (glutaredoxin) [Sphingomonas donggukensis]|uniref:Arsenate reductase n=1 Tax=Sphingomonas donggukensis TaxID=2949093 RepID=A0ABY4TRP8_9SPHN|nr:arsenate reductase (glutaredoxin) [Sphingomonas donggukensis]URW74416.1 arsenate reductase (glutaredoxin) [Sphingomonas donggukensis]